MGSRASPADHLTFTCSSPHWMAISQIPARTAHISFLLWELIILQTRSWQIFPHPMVILQIPVLTAHYSESLSFGRPGLGRSTPHQMAISQIPVKFIFHSYSDSSTFGRPGLCRSTTLIKGNFTDSCSTLRVHIWQTKCWQIYPLSNGNFADFCSDSSYFIPTLRANHFADQVLTDLPPIQWWFYRFLFWQLTTLRIYHLADQVLADLSPHQMAISQIPALTAHYSKISTFGRPGLGRYDPPIRWQFHRLLLWQLIFHSYSESSTFGRPGLGRSTPLINGNFTDSCSTLKAHILADKVLADLTPHINGNFTDSCSTLRDHIWQAKFWQIYPHIKWQFHRFLWNSYFIPTLRAQHLADQVLADLPPIKYWFHRWLFIESHAAPADHLALHLQISPLNGNFTDSCSDSSYFIPTLRAQHLADQVLTGLPPIQWWFYRFLFWQLTTLRAYHSTDHV